MSKSQNKDGKMSQSYLMKNDYQNTSFGDNSQNNSLILNFDKDQSLLKKNVFKSNVDDG